MTVAIAVTSVVTTVIPTVLAVIAAAVLPVPARALLALPAVLQEVHRRATGVVAAAVARPVLLMAWQHPQVTRQHWLPLVALLDDHRLLHGHLWLQTRVYTACPWLQALGFALKRALLRWRKATR